MSGIDLCHIRVKQDGARATPCLLLASLFIVLALVAMAYYGRFDTGEYPPKGKAAQGGNPEKAQRPR